MKLKPGEGNIPDYRKQAPVDVQKNTEKYVESLKKGKIKSEEKIIELTPSQEVVARHQIGPKRLKISDLVNIENFKKPGSKVDMKAYGEAIKNTIEKLKNKNRYVPTPEEQKLLEGIDETLAEIEKKKEEAAEKEKQFNKDIDEILEKLKSE
jgi:hypothetical protein